MVNTDIFGWLEWAKPIGDIVMATPEFWVLLVGVLGALWLLVQD